MKYRIYIIIVAVLSVMAIGCDDDFLDRQIGTELSQDQVFKSYDFTERFLAGIYSYLPNGFNDVAGAMRESATDNAEHTWDGSDIHLFNNGSWSPYLNPDDQWNNLYAGIRKVNLLLENIHNVNLDQYKLNPLPAVQTEYNARAYEVKRWEYEARFLRAYFYFELVKRYNAVPIITETLSIDGDLNIPRNTLKECIDFIVNECETVGRTLKLYPGRTSGDVNATGRATKGAAYALRSRVLLYAASPLFLDHQNVASTSVLSDPLKWQVAAEAAKVVIDSCGTTYQLVTDYSNFFNKVTSKDLILQKQYGSINTFEKANYPIGYQLGQSGTTPSQNLVDAYEMSNGKPIIDPTSGYNPQNPYLNRDPRLLKTIVVNNSMWSNRNVEAWTGGKDGKGKDRATKTGYYLKKHVVEKLDLVQDQKAIHTWPLLRLAEVYLNYAEALNEYDPGNVNIAKYVNLVRKRAGMPDLPTGLAQNEMRQRIRNERRVELAFEDHRFWDIRRWKEGTAFDLPIKGIEIMNDGSNNFTYKYITVENRYFEPKMYWYPIPQNEMLKSPEWSQNSGW